MSPTRTGAGVVLVAELAWQRASEGGADVVAVLAERWTTMDGVEVFYRESTGGAAPMMHLHGFGLSGRYLVPTAERLAGEFHTLVPDLPGFGRSGRALQPARRPRPRRRRRGLPRRPGARVGHARRQLDGLRRSSASSPTSYPDRLDRAVLVSPAGGLHNQPLQRAIRQLARDGVREPTAADAGGRPRLPALRRAEHAAACSAH